MSKRSEPEKLPTVRLETWLLDNGLAEHTRFDRACFHHMAGLLRTSTAARVGTAG